MAIRFPPERRQPPPHYTAGARQREVVVERPIVRAIVHADAMRIASQPEVAPRPAGTRCTPHAIAFTHRRPPPGTVVVAPAARRTVQAIAYPDASIGARPRPFVERRTAHTTAPHRIEFPPAIPPPRHQR